MTKPTIKSILLNSILYGFFIATNIAFSMQTTPNALQVIYSSGGETPQYQELNQEGKLLPIAAGSKFDNKFTRKSYLTKTNSLYQVNKKYPCLQDNEGYNFHKESVILGTITAAQADASNTALSKKENEVPLHIFVFDSNSNTKSYLLKEHFDFSTEKKNDNSLYSKHTEITPTLLDHSDSNILQTPSKVVYTRFMDNQNAHLQKDASLYKGYDAVLKNKNDINILQTWDQESGFKETEITTEQAETIKKAFHAGESIIETDNKSGLHSRLYPCDPNIIYITAIDSKGNPTMHSKVSLYMQDSTTRAYHAIGADGMHQKIDDNSIDFLDISDGVEHNFKIKMEDGRLTLTIWPQNAPENTIKTYPTEEQITEICTLTSKGIKVIFAGRDYNYILTTKKSDNEPLLTLTSQNKPDNKPATGSGGGLLGLIASYIFFPELLKNIPNFLKNIDFSQLKRLITH